jgi:hypothetical protein
MHGAEMKKEHSMNRARSPRLLTAVALSGAVLASYAAYVGGVSPRTAEACGCFAPPDLAVPIIQAGERILFAHQNGTVTAHIQLQYSGRPDEFGWLLPLPSVPIKRNGMQGIDVGVDELFTQLLNQTQPKYRLNRVFEQCGSGSARGGNLAFAAAEDSDATGGPPSPQAMSSPVVVQSTVGPFDYAVLRADNKTEMLNWLRDSKYVVPVGTDQVVDPYIRPGSFFLALKLKPGLSAGDLQPVVLKYQSDLPMIPIILTSVAATRNMGVQVWMLGSGRAIPRNYYHTVVNDAQINWFNSGQNYNDVIINAVGEAEGKHSFVTEYAGTSGVMRSILDRPGRFTNVSALATVTDPVSYMEQAIGPLPLNGQFTTIVSRYIPLPAALAQQNITLAQYYQQLRFYLKEDRALNPNKYMDIEAALASFDPAMLTAELQAKIVEPTLEAGALFNAFPYLTRMYTTLSPEDMNSDPVFSYNPGLADYPNVHEATLTYHCAGFFSKERYSDATLDTPSGFRLQFTVDDANNNVWNPIDAPYSQQIQVLRETGAEEVIVDNTAAIRGALGQSGCMQSGPASRRGGATSALGLMLGAAGLAALLRVRRGRQSS